MLISRQRCTLSHFESSYDPIIMIYILFKRNQNFASFGWSFCSTLSCIGKVMTI